MKLANLNMMTLHKTIVGLFLALDIDSLHIGIRVFSCDFGHRRCLVSNDAVAAALGDIRNLTFPEFHFGCSGGRIGPLDAVLMTLTQGADDEFTIAL